MRHRPHTDVYVPETIDDELGRGLRIYTSEDDVYEARGVGNVLSRMYSDYGQWHAKVRLPVTSPDTVADEIMDVTDRLEDQYDTRFDQDADDLQQYAEVVEDFMLDDAEERFTIRFNPEDKVDIPESYLDVVGGVGMGATYVGTGAAIGFALGGPAGAVAFGLPAAAVGGLTGLGAFAADQWIADAFDTHKTPTFYVMDKLKEGREESFRQKIPEDTGFWDKVNHGDSDAQRAHHDLMQKQFYDAEKLQGVTVSTEMETYEDVARFTGTVMGRTDVDMEQPSVYRSITAFKELFETLDRPDKAAVLWQYFDSELEMDKHVQNYLKKNGDDHGPYTDLVEDVADQWKLHIRGDTQ